MTTLTITLPRPPSANNLFINLRHGKGRARSLKYRHWAEEAGWIVKQQRPKKISGPYSLSLFVRRPDKRRRDISNLLKAAEDLLVDLQIIPDDSRCQEVHGYWHDYEHGADCFVVISERAEAA